MRQASKNAEKSAGGGGSGSRNWLEDDLQLLIKAVNLFPAGTNSRYWCSGCVFSVRTGHSRTFTDGLCTRPCAVEVKPMWAILASLALHQQTCTCNYRGGSGWRRVGQVHRTCCWVSWTVAPFPVLALCCMPAGAPQKAWGRWPLILLMASVRCFSESVFSGALWKVYENWINGFILVKQFWNSSIKGWNGFPNYCTQVNLSVC